MQTSYRWNANSPKWEEVDNQIKQQKTEYCLLMQDLESGGINSCSPGTIAELLSVT